MQDYNILIANRAVSLMSDDSTLVRTSSGVDTVHLYFADEEWLDFDTVHVAFSNGDTLESVQIWPWQSYNGYAAEYYARVPSSVLEQVGNLGVTVYGTNADNDFIVTERAYPLQVVKEGDEEANSYVPIRIVNLNVSDTYGEPRIVEDSENQAIDFYWYSDSSFDGHQGVIIDTYGRTVKMMNLNTSGYLNLGSCAEGSNLSNWDAMQKFYGTYYPNGWRTLVVSYGRYKYAMAFSEPRHHNDGNLCHARFELQ